MLRRSESGEMDRLIDLYIYIDMCMCVPSGKNPGVKKQPLWENQDIW